MRRIVELACLLATDAQVLCLDEPTAGVAQREAEAFGPLLLRIRAELDASMLVIEHDMPLVMSISDRIVCLEAGAVIASGTPAEVRNDPRVVASYLGTDAVAIDRSDAGAPAHTTTTATSTTDGPGAPMTTSLGQYCLNVRDLDAAVAFYTALGLECTSRTEIPQAFEAIVENPAGGSKLQLAQQKEPADPFDLGTAFWKLYVNTHDIAATWEATVAAGATVESKPERLDRWPVTVGFVRDPDGYLVEFVERDPWPPEAPGTPWLGQYCLNVTDIEASIAF